MFSALISTGPLVLIAGLFTVALIYPFHRNSATGRRLPLLRYAALTLGAGIAAFCAGAAAGIGIACFGAGASNLCGLVGVFGLGPLLAGIAMVATALWAVRQPGGKP